MTTQSVLHEIARLKDESCSIVDVTQCPSICEGCPIPMLADVAVRLLTERDAALADNQRLTERNTALEVVIRQAHYKLQHHSATYEAMRILGAALDALCAAKKEDE